MELSEASVLGVINTVSERRGDPKLADRRTLDVRHGYTQHATDHSCISSYCGLVQGSSALWLRVPKAHRVTAVSGAHREHVGSTRTPRCFP